MGQGDGHDEPALRRRCGRDCAAMHFEAAHVHPYADGGEHALPNGLLLRADIHRLYDAGYVRRHARLAASA